jgi:hypothetical protein
MLKTKYHDMKTYERLEGNFYALTSELDAEASDQLHAPTTLSPEKARIAW